MHPDEPKDCTTIGYNNMATIVGNDGPEILKLLKSVAEDVQAIKINHIVRSEYAASYVQMQSIYQHECMYA